jgi:hypothetical protein
MQILLNKEHGQISSQGKTEIQRSRQHGRWYVSWGEN